MKIMHALAVAALSIAAFNASAYEYKMAEVNFGPPKVAVYNDGRNTYIQSIPGLIIRGAVADGDRLIVSGVPREIHGSMAGKPITINQYASSQGLPSASPVPAASVAAPAAPAEALAARLARLERDLEKKEQAYRATAAGAHAASVVAQTSPTAEGPSKTATSPKPSEPVKAKEPEQVWEIRKGDGTLYGALSRWAAAAKPKRQLIYATDNNDFASDPEASFTGDFDSAIAQVMESMQHSTYPLRACMWDNKPYPVLKIVHKNKRCED